MINKIAEMLNNCEYRKETTEEILDLAMNNNIVIVYGASDDLMEFQGAINDEISAWEGTTVFISKDGIFEACECECKYSIAEKEKCNAIEAVWDDADRNCSWSYKTDIPHAEFTVMEDGDVYCHGVVFSMNDLGGLK